MVIHNFYKGIGPEVNVIARLEFELAYYDVAVQHNSHHATGTPCCTKLSTKIVDFAVDMLKIYQAWPY